MTLLEAFTWAVANLRDHPPAGLSGWTPNQLTEWESARDEVRAVLEEYRGWVTEREEQRAKRAAEVTAVTGGGK